MLRVPQNHPGRKQRGRGCCAISSLPTPSSFASASVFRMLSPTVPVHPRNAPVSPIIPVHTQKQGGGGGCLLQNVFAYNPFVFCGPVNQTVKCNCRGADIPVSAQLPQIARAGRLISNQEAGIEDSAPIEARSWRQSGDWRSRVQRERNPRPRHRRRAWGTRLF
jgi:hypothetical protein